MKWHRTQTKKTTDGEVYGNGWNSDNSTWYIEQILDGVELPGTIQTQYRYVTESYEVWGPDNQLRNFYVKDYGSAPKAKKAAKEYCENWQGPVKVHRHATAGLAWKAW